MGTNHQKESVLRVSPVSPPFTKITTMLGGQVLDRLVWSRPEKVGIRGYFSIFLKPTVGVKRGTVHKITALPVGLSEMTLEDLDSLASAALRRRTNMTWETFNRFKDDTRAICFLEHYEIDRTPVAGSVRKAGKPKKTNKQRR